METFGKGEVKIEEIIDNSEKGKLLLSDFGLHLLTGNCSNSYFKKVSKMEPCVFGI